MLYDKTNPKSIEDYAKNLIWKTLRKYLPQELQEQSGKWKYGQLLEEYYFWYKPNSDACADFPEAWVELKSAAVVRRSKKWIRAKERLVLNIIDYISVIDESWENSSFRAKNSLILLVLYLYEKGGISFDSTICMVEMFRFSDYEYDLEIIKKDWEIIIEKIRKWKAHELSEGDTMYLGACTKWATAEGSHRKQPRSDIKAKQRAFSFKQGYMNSVLEKFSWNDTRYKQLFGLSKIKEKTFEEGIKDFFTPYLKKTAYQIKLDLGIKSKAKSRYHLISTAILWVETVDDIDEFRKAGIKIKTIRLKPNGIPKEDISFPVFKFKEIITQEWENSELYELLEWNKFLFVVYRMNVKKEADFARMSPEEQDKHLIFDKAILWNAPGWDIENKARKTWENTCGIIKKGVKLEEKEGRTFNNLPSKSETDMIHVRPHGQNKEDTDELPDGRLLTKQCFWFNNDYIGEQIRNI